MTENVKNMYQGLFVTETVLGNPNGSFVNNEPRNIDGRVFTTDKCIKYNIRRYMKEKYEEIEKDEKIKDVENFVFFYPRKSPSSDKGEPSYLEKDSVFRDYFVAPYEEVDEFDRILNKSKNQRSKKEKQRLKEIYSNSFKKLFKKSLDVSLFGGTFSLKEHNRSIYGPVQISYGIDLIGADLINPQLGTPFSTEDGSQTTKGQDYLIDHAVIGYDITVNPNNERKLLNESDIKKFKEGIVKGTNLRKSTSKSTDAKLLMMVKFAEGKALNLGELKHLIEVESEKITDPEERPKKLVLDLSKIKDKLDNFKEAIEEIEVYSDEGVKVKNFYDKGDNMQVKYQGFHKL